MPSSFLRENFRMLSPFLRVDPKAGICLKDSPHMSRSRRSALIAAPKLKYYSADEQTRQIVEHNTRWARGRENNPMFQFVYLMLPTKCNQKCVGCFTGQDKGRLPPELNGSFYSLRTLKMILSTLRELGVKTIVHAGGGELFTWHGAFAFIDRIHNSGFNQVIFTNGTLLNRAQIRRLNSLRLSLIVSIKDTVELKHNECVGFNGFSRTLKTMEYAIEEGMNTDGRLAVEIPVTRENGRRILKHLLPTLRTLNVVPFIEELIVTSTSREEKGLCHTFDECREFFQKAWSIDKTLGYSWDIEYRQRILGEPGCGRRKYSFAIYPNGDVINCPCWPREKKGNFYSAPLHEIVCSGTFKRKILDSKPCACSVFYTKSVRQLKEYLPEHLHDLVKARRQSRTTECSVLCSLGGKKAQSLLGEKNSHRR